MKILGDSYGIYGFSGMKRSKSELYHIKHLDEPYSEAVQQRIAAISPQEYTRMGPPIRHLTPKLLSFEGKVRLLILISDGKPEDYDGMKVNMPLKTPGKHFWKHGVAGYTPSVSPLTRQITIIYPICLGMGIIYLSIMLKNSP